MKNSESQSPYDHISRAACSQMCTHLDNEIAFLWKSHHPSTRILWERTFTIISTSNVCTYPEIITDICITASSLSQRDNPSLGSKPRKRWGQWPSWQTSERSRRICWTYSWHIQLSHRQIHFQLIQLDLPKPDIIVQIIVPDNHDFRT